MLPLADKPPSLKHTSLSAKVENGRLIEMYITDKIQNMPEAPLLRFSRNGLKRILSHKQADGTSREYQNYMFSLFLFVIFLNYFFPQIWTLFSCFDFCWCFHMLTNLACFWIALEVYCLWKSNVSHFDSEVLYEIMNALWQDRRTFTYLVESNQVAFGQQLQNFETFVIRKMYWCCLSFISNGTSESSWLLLSHHFKTTLFK